MKRYELSLSNFDGGRTEKFRKKENALAYFEEHKHEWLFIDLKDTKTGKEERLQDSKLRPCYNIRTVYYDTCSVDLIESVTYEEID